MLLIFLKSPTGDQKQKVNLIPSNPSADRETNKKNIDDQVSYLYFVHKRNFYVQTQVLDLIEEMRQKYSPFKLSNRNETGDGTQPKQNHLKNEPTSVTHSRAESIAKNYSHLDAPLSKK